MSIFKIGISIFFNLHLILSLLFLIFFAVSFVRGTDADLKNLKTGVIGLVAVIVTSLFLKWLPQFSSEIDNQVGYWSSRFLFLIISLGIIIKADEEDYKVVSIFFAVALVLLIVLHVGERMSSLY